MQLRPPPVFYIGLIALHLSLSAELYARVITSYMHRASGAYLCIGQLGLERYLRLLVCCQYAPAKYERCYSKGRKRAQRRLRAPHLPEVSPEPARSTTRPIRSALSAVQLLQEKSHIFTTYFLNSISSRLYRVLIETFKA